MTNSNIAVDTNILIYLYDELDDRKRNIAERIVSDGPYISTQVISEFLNISKRLLNLPKKETLQRCCKVISNCTISPVTQNNLKLSVSLIEKYNFQLFDSIIVAVTLESNCGILYSEDMQHNLVVNDTLRIINPFL